jgi:predicted transcriptional regulator
MDTLTNKYAKAAAIIVRAGILPFVISDTLLEIVKIYLTEEEADFIIKNFDKDTTLSIDQLKEKSGLSESDIEKMTNGLAKKGFIFNQPNTKGVMIYRLLPLIVVGAFEYTFMKERMEGEKIKEFEKIAKLYHKLLQELRNTIQSQYDALLPIFEVQPAPDRTVPLFTNENGKPIKIIIDETVKVEELVMPSKTVEEIIRKNDDIAVGYCFCRNYNKVLGHDCETNAPDEVCFTFGKSARHVVNQGFARKITQEEALKY